MAAKMKKKSPAKKYKSDAQRKAVHASKAEKSPAKKALVGKQKNLPKELRDKILASPAKMLKPAAMKLMKAVKSVGKSAAGAAKAGAKAAKKSPAKMNYKKK